MENVSSREESFNLVNEVTPKPGIFKIQCFFWETELITCLEAADVSSQLKMDWEPLQ